MLKFPVPYQTAIFFCNNQRPDGHPKPCCANRSGRELREELREMVRERGLDDKVKVFLSGCIGGCEQGPNAIKYPGGEMMLQVSREDLVKILDEAAGEE